MARLPRIELPNIPQHIIQRGNNRQACFASEQDFKTYLNWLKNYSIEAGVEIHAWVLMTNHVHLLCTPTKPKAISKLMQNLGRRYVQYFNYTHGRSGTLWEGRFKSCLVQDNSYLLHVYRYIDMNPVRASMVADPAQYTWSSYQVNALGKASDLCSPHAEYFALGVSRAERQLSYQELFKHHVLAELQTDIRNSVVKGLALGSDKFKEDMEALCGRRVKEGKKGRPKGWRKTI
jgi:putative transposase